MVVSLLPLFHVPLRAFRVPLPDLREVADDCWTVAPAWHTRRQQALYLPGQLERIRGTQEDTDLESELARLNDGPIAHGATTAYLLRGAVLLDGILYKGLYRERVLAGARRRVRIRAHQIEERATLATSLYSSRFFGHWMMDDILKQRAVSLMPDQLGRAYVPLRERSSHEAIYSQMLGLSCQEVGDATFRELVVIDDCGQNLFKRERYAWLRRALIDAAGLPADPAPHAGVFVVRGTGGVRRVLRNEAELAERVARSRGYRIVDPLTLSPREIVAACAGARVVVGVEGSALVHPLLLMNEGTTLICLEPPTRFNNIYKDVTDCVGASYGVVVGLPAGDDFEIPLEDLERTLDLVHESARARAS